MKLMRRLVKGPRSGGNRDGCEGQQKLLVIGGEGLEQGKEKLAQRAVAEPSAKTKCCSLTAQTCSSGFPRGYPSSALSITAGRTTRSLIPLSPLSSGGGPSLTLNGLAIRGADCRAQVSDTEFHLRGEKTRLNSRELELLSALGTVCSVLASAQRH